MKFSCTIFGMLALVTVLSGCLPANTDKSLIVIKGTVSRPVTHADPRSAADVFINNPFVFTILKNYSDDFKSIGTIRSNKTNCPLEKENIADPAFCMIRVVEYDGLRVRVFSFDVLQSGTAEYIVTDGRVKLMNGLAVGSTAEEVSAKLGKPFKKKGDLWVWRSGDLHNFLTFAFTDGRVSQIRWHEEREPSYKDVVVWNTHY